MATIRLRANRLPQLAKALPMAVSTALRRGTAATLAGGRARSPVDTGAMRASHSEGGTQPGSLSMRVTVGVEYAEFVHEGTRTAPPRPWLRETTEQTFPATINELKQLERSL
jgi:HK97 gp10 family phage protein